MKAIITKYHGQTTTSPGRYSAFDADSNCATISAHDDTEPGDGHERAFRALCRKMGWCGRFVRGSHRHDGEPCEIFVWIASYPETTNTGEVTLDEIAATEPTQ